MKSAIIVFPGTNRERDMAIALEKASGTAPFMVWHKDSEIPDVDLIVVPGGFSYGDYLRAGAMAAHSPVLRSLKEKANKGTPVMGVCNGFQVLTETGLLPGVLMRNAGLKFICRNVGLKVETSQSLFTGGYEDGQVLSIPVAHNDGNYFADNETLDRIEQNGQVAFRFGTAQGQFDLTLEQAGFGGKAAPFQMTAPPGPEQAERDLRGRTGDDGIAEDLKHPDHPLKPHQQFGTRPVTGITGLLAGHEPVKLQDEAGADCLLETQADRDRVALIRIGRNPGAYLGHELSAFLVEEHLIARGGGDHVLRPIAQRRSIIAEIGGREQDAGRDQRASGERIPGRRGKPVYGPGSVDV